MKKHFLALCLLLLAMSGCKKYEGTQGVLASLYRQYRDGSIGECRLDGQKVYTAGQNAYDAGEYIYDSTGNKIADCIYGLGTVDALCGKLKECETIYRCNGHISGEPFVDKYGLSK